MPPKIPLPRNKTKTQTKQKQDSRPVPVPVERSVDFCRVFVEGNALPGSMHYTTAMERVREAQNGYVWLSLREPSAEQMERVAEEFGIHDLIVEDAVAAHQRPKVERFGEQLFFVIRTVVYRDDEEVADLREIISTGEVQMLLGENFVITIRHNAELPNLTQELIEDQEIASLGPAAVAWKVADHIVENYMKVTTFLSSDVDELENEVFTPRHLINIDKIYMYKREVLEMRHATDPLGPALRSGLTLHKDLLSKPIRSYLRDVQDNAMIVSDHVSGFDERLSSLLDASVAKVSMQQNSDMRTISAVVGMAALPTMIAGVYGMNFEYMPELGWHYAYPVVLLVMFGSILGMYWWFRKNHWL
ncbi:magnesium and cobalt transport protein CorA [Corynebacterium sp. P3-F1]|uniref:magnesium and cobalt transport protein CorA n=1 Tax=Corynebacterium sp. P3-F1 TaxID=3059080 RepID=UPI00265CDD36|nr:magnesium and cobalt transport protein CorA [Corynebacterium sp. P3-F1]WKK61519.1 magnesium and cobalt transport protein CorA [Corynebacterium sp. P3-F1]